MSYAWADVTATGSPYPAPETIRLAGGFAAAPRALAPPTAAGTRRLPSAPKAPSLMSARRAIPILFVASIFILPPRPRKRCVCFTPRTAGLPRTSPTASFTEPIPPLSSTTPPLQTGHWDLLLSDLRSGLVQQHRGGFYRCSRSGQQSAVWIQGCQRRHRHAECQNFLGQTYNNLSGNWRFDNVTVGGTSGTPPPAIAFDPNATVDNPFTNTYTDNPAWRTNISAIYVNGLILTNTAYTTNYCGRNRLQSREIRSPPGQRSVKYFHHFARVWNGEGVPAAGRRGGHETGLHHPGRRPLGQRRHLDRQSRFSRFRPIRQRHHESLRQCHDHCSRRRCRRLDFGWRHPTGVSQRPDRLHQLDGHRQRLIARFRCLHHVHGGWLRCDLQHEFSHCSTLARRRFRSRRATWPSFRLTRWTTTRPSASSKSILPPLAKPRR